MAYESRFAKPLVSINVMSRAQEDLINFQTMPFVKTGRSGIKAALNLYNLLWLFCNPTTLVTGRPRHPHSQGAVERLNGVVQEKLAIWMQEKM
ncbi:hypothetical protein T07_8350 [Trichinella nelsoni]|uniref:KRAB-A domain-containing protein 2 n=1 Tax=Trichinella nelsoni TaxID=6336 RepID=A0A0V0SFS3_9BILA|nr:hypothetical protein T07_8350 [Trichinella nelsoni]